MLIVLYLQSAPEVDLCHVTCGRARKHLPPQRRTSGKTGKRRIAGRGSRDNLTVDRGRGLLSIGVYLLGQARRICGYVTVLGICSMPIHQPIGPPNSPHLRPRSSLSAHRALLTADHAHIPLSLLFIHTAHRDLGNAPDRPRIRLLCTSPHLGTTPGGRLNECRRQSSIGLGRL
jgi:hypothetical protein